MTNSPITEFTLWLDLETTGLSPISDKILEFAAVLTPAGNSSHRLLTVQRLVEQIDSKQALVEKLPPAVLHMHQQNRLLEDLYDETLSFNRVPLPILDSGVTQMVALYTEAENRKVKIRLGGNSVHFDKSFIDAQMPKLSQMLHHQIIDVSTLVNVSRLEHCSYPSPDVAHRALDDVNMSIDNYQQMLGVFLP